MSAGRRAGSKFQSRSRRSSTVRGSPGKPSSRSSFIGEVLDPAGVDLDAAGDAPARGLCDALDERGPHVQLDLLGHAQAVVEEVREAVAAARPRLDLEAHAALRRRQGAKLDL